MKVKVDVPAANGRKAYSYMREGGEESAKLKSSGISKSAAAGLGAIAVGGLALGGLAIKSSRKKQEQFYQEKTRKAIEDLNEKDRDFSEAHSKNMQDLEDISSRAENIGKDSPLEGMSIEELDEAKQSVAEARRRVQEFKQSKGRGTAKKSEPFIDVKSEEVKDGFTTTIVPSESGKSSESSAIAESRKSLLTQVAGSAGAAAGRLVRKVKESGERDRIAREQFASRNINLNEAARKAGTGTKSTLAAVDNFARSFMQTFVDNKNTINAKVSEVKPNQKAIPSRTRRANKTLSSRRYNSLDCRIDSFIQLLRTTP